MMKKQQQNIGTQEDSIIDEDYDETIAKPFWSADYAHYVEWGGPLEYPTWWCLIHDKAYYKYCMI